MTRIMCLSSCVELGRVMKVRRGWVVEEEGGMVKAEGGKYDGRIDTHGVTIIKPTALYNEHSVIFDHTLLFESGEEILPFATI